MKLHYLENSQAIRIVWLLEELKCDYEVIVYKRDPKTKLAPKEYKALHPVGTSPILEIDGHMLPETNAIIDYLLARFPNKLRPTPSEQEFQKYNYWFHAGQGTLMPILTMSFVFYTVTQKVPFFLKPILKKVSSEIHKMMINPRIHGVLKTMESDLTNVNYLAGNEISAADISMSYTLEVTDVRIGLNDYPNCKKYLKRLKENKTYLASKEKVGGFSATP